MPGLEIHAFSVEHVDDAARLLAARFARERAAEPLLPEVDDLRPHVERELGRDGASGVLATRGGDAVGYLIGRVEEGKGGGAARAWVENAGNALAEPEAVADLYAALAANWAEAGTAAHAIVVPASEHEVVDALFRKAFGCQFMLAVRETEALEPFDAGVAIRLGHPADLDAVARFDKILWDLQAGSPSFAGLPVPSLDEFRDEWSDLWDDPELFTHFVAERDGTLAGHIVLYRRRAAAGLPADPPAALPRGSVTCT